MDKIYKSALAYKNRLIKAYFKPVPNYSDMMLLYCLIPNNIMEKPKNRKDSKYRNEWIEKYKHGCSQKFEQLINEL